MASGFETAHPPPPRAIRPRTKEIIAKGDICFPSRKSLNKQAYQIDFPRKFPLETGNKNEKE
jgi:hypothetical protein